MHWTELSSDNNVAYGDGVYLDVDFEVMSCCIYFQIQII